MKQEKELKYRHCATIAVGQVVGEILSKGKELKCPECNGKMILVETWDSINKIATWYKYGCEYCGGTFEVKRGKI